MDEANRAAPPGILARIALAAVLGATFTVVQALAGKPGTMAANADGYSVSDTTAAAGDCVPVEPCSIEVAAR